MKRKQMTLLNVSVVLKEFKHFLFVSIQMT